MHLFTLGRFKLEIFEQKKPTLMCLLASCYGGATGTKKDQQTATASPVRRRFFFGVFHPKFLCLVIEGHFLYSL